MAQLLAVLIAMMAGVAISALFVAVVVQLATSMIFKFKPSYGMSYKAVFLGGSSPIMVGNHCAVPAG